jgi:hypothetical protein
MGINNQREEKRMPDDIHILARRAAQAKKEGKLTRLAEIGNQALVSNPGGFVRVNRIFKEIAGVDLSKGIEFGRHTTQISEICG